MNILDFRNESLRILTAGKEPSEAFMCRFYRFMDFWIQHCELTPEPTTNQLLGKYPPLPELKETPEEKVELEGLENLAEQETKAIKRNYHLK